MDTSGDGFFVIFHDAKAAIEAAQAIIARVSPLGLEVRIGVHLGDCEVADHKCTGIAIHIAARIVALAAPGEVLVSEAIRTSFGNDGYRFIERRTHELRGMPAKWQLFALAEGPPAGPAWTPIPSVDTEGLPLNVAWTRSLVFYRVGEGRNRLPSSVRWRSVRPAMVLESAMRHWVRIRPALTDPILGSTTSRSRTLAVRAQAGGRARIAASPTLPVARSLFSLALLVRTWFACFSARRRCSLVTPDRSPSPGLTPSESTKHEA
jgi:hypothetical protein